MQGGLVTRKPSVRPSLCLSVKRVDCDKTEESSAHYISQLRYSGRR